MDGQHTEYCHQIPNTRRGCYCWEGDKQQLLEMRVGNMEEKMHAAANEIERLREEVKFWQATAETAMQNTDKALAVIELHKAIKTELEKAVSDD
jgi:vacuolar-type H+-ATPase subunit D/Vma8